MTELELGISIGLYEGEGSVSYNKGSGFKITMEQHRDSFDVLERFQKLHGGSMFLTKKNTYCLSLSTQFAFKFLVCAYKHLSERRKRQVRKAIEQSNGDYHLRSYPNFNLLLLEPKME